MRALISGLAVVVVVSLVAWGGWYVTQVLPQATQQERAAAAAAWRGVRHVLPSGDEIRVLHLQNTVARDTPGTVEHGFDVEVVSAVGEADRLRLADEVFSDLAAFEADRRQMDKATVTIRSDSNAAPVVVTYARGGGQFWTRDGAPPLDTPPAFNLKSPANLKLRGGDVLQIEGERVQPHMRADGGYLLESWLNWPQNAWEPVPPLQRRQRAYELLRQYWLERGKAIAEAQKAQMVILRIYTEPYWVRLHSRQHLWTGVVRKGSAWAEMPLLVDEAAKLQFALTSLRVDPGNRVKLPSGTTMSIEAVDHIFFTEGTYRKGLILVYRPDKRLDDKKAVEVDMQIVFDGFLKQDCYRERVRSCQVEARYELFDLAGFGWDDTHDLMFEMTDGTWRAAP